MAKTLLLDNGSMEVITGDIGVFLERFLYERIGRDAAELFRGYVEDQKQDAVDKLLDREADGYLAMCRDAMNRFEQLIRLLDAPRLNRKALKMVAQEGYDDLYKNL